MRNHRLTRLTAIVVLGIVVASCGSDDESSTDSVSASVESETTAAQAESTAAESESTAQSESTSESTESTAAESESTAAETETSEAVVDGCTSERSGGDVTMATWAPERGLDPLVGGDSGPNGSIELAQVYDTLMQWDPETGEFSPRVAESLEPNDDFTQWTLKLRAGITFGNGDPLTTEAVKFTVERHQDPANRSLAKAITSNVSGMTIIDDLTMTFELVSSWPAFPFMLSQKAGMVINPRVLEELGPEAFNLLPTGAGVGPFEPVRFSPGEEVVLESKDDYWGGPVCIDQLRFIPINDGKTAYEAFQAGEVDVAFLREPGAIATSRDDDVPGLSTLVNSGEILIMNHGTNGSTPPTTDVRVRLAIVHALDVDALNERVDGGAGKSTSATVSPDSLYYGGVEGPQYDPDLARSLVDEVVAEGAWDGSLEFVCFNDPRRTEQSIAVKAQLEAVGFKVNLINLATPDLVTKVNTNLDYQLACNGVSGYDALLWEGFNRFFHTSDPPSFTGYSNPDFDAAIDELRSAVSADEQREIIGRLQTLWNEDAPSATTSAVEEVIIHSPDIVDIQLSSKSMIYFSDAYWND